VRYVMFIFILISALIVSGCSLFGKKFDNDEVIAEVRGTEITYGDIRFLYEDDDIEDGVTIAINIELARQGVEELQLDITEQWEENKEFVRELTPKNEATEYELAEWEFAEKQAKKFDMDPNEYYVEYMTKSMEDLSYFLTYAHEMVGEPADDSEEEIDEFNRKINIMFEELHEKYEDEIKRYD